jgi:hypothetical protein
VLAAGAGIALVPQQATANGCVHAGFAGGVGSADDPFRVSTPTQLQAAAAGSCVGYDFVLTNDIDLTGRGEFTPIGDQFLPFIGTWDGRGHSITGLSISAPTGDGFGLFGHTIGATIRNMTVRGSVSGGRRNAALVVGFGSDTSISKVHVSGTVDALREAGGIAGQLRGATSSVTDSSVAASVTANGDGSAGGIAGVMDGAISRVQVSGSVIAPYGSTYTGAGGIAGTAGGSAISLATNTADVTGNRAGGILGWAFTQATSITDSSSTGSVTEGMIAGGALGGIVGSACEGWGHSFVRTYAAGRLLTRPGSSATTGGILGGSDLCMGSVSPLGTVTGNLWDSDKAGAAGAGGSGVGVGRTTAQMKQLGTYTELGWSIVNGWEPAGSSTWGICPQVNNGYPFLQSSSAGTACKAPTATPSAATPPALQASVLPSRRRMVSGQAIRIGVRARNTGGTAAASMVSCVRLPPRLVLVRAPGAVRSGRVACFQLGTVAAGAQATRTVTARAVSLRRATVTVTGSARATGLNRVAAAPVTVTVTPRAARARVTG